MSTVSAVTHFETYGGQSASLAAFYQQIVGWEIKQISGVSDWCMQVGTSELPSLDDGLTHRSIPRLNAWMLSIKIASPRPNLAIRP